MSLLDNLFGLWWVAATSGIASVVVAWWGWRGPHAVRAPRLVLAVALAALSISYWWQIVGNIPRSLDGPAELRRAAGIIWYPAMAWTALAGLRQSRRQHEQIATIIEQATAEGDE